VNTALLSAAAAHASRLGLSVHQKLQLMSKQDQYAAASDQANWDGLTASRLASKQPTLV